MDKLCHRTLNWTCDYLSILRFGLIHVSNRGPWSYSWATNCHGDRFITLHFETASTKWYTGGSPCPNNCGIPSLLRNTCNSSWEQAWQLPARYSANWEEVLLGTSVGTWYFLSQKWKFQKVISDKISQHSVTKCCLKRQVLTWKYIWCGIVYEAVHNKKKKTNQHLCSSLVSKIFEQYLANHHPEGPRILA